MNDILFNYVKSCMGGKETFSEGILYVMYQEERLRRAMQKRGRPRFICSEADLKHCANLSPAEAAAYLGCSVATYSRLKNGHA